MSSTGRAAAQGTRSPKWVSHSTAVRACSAARSLGTSTRVLGPLPHRVEARIARELGSPVSSHRAFQKCGVLAEM